jgi:excisionase family DNA binding protein
MDPSELLTAGDAARLLGVSASTIRLWAQLGKIPSRRTAGGVRLFLRVDCERVAKTRRDALTGTSQVDRS